MIPSMKTIWKKFMPIYFKITKTYWKKLFFNKFKANLRDYDELIESIIDKRYIFLFKEKFFKEKFVFDKEVFLNKIFK